MDIYAQIVEKIVKEQATIIGPVALEQAQKVPGLHVDADMSKITFDGNKKEIIDNLINKYVGLFGRTSVEVCKEAVRGIVSKAPQNEIPQMLL